MREPDQTMAAAGDAGTWTRMVEAVLAEAAPVLSQNRGLL
jgi:hypothetical protein